MKYSIDKINTAYFIGIGGVSMSSLASILIMKGKKVYGYDMRESEATVGLAGEGAIISYDENSDIPGDVDTIIYTAAMSEESPLMKKARASGAVVLSRAELLGAVAGEYRNSIGVSGTHGKSTTTGFLASIFLEYDKNSAVLSGAMLPFLGSYYKCGTGDNIVYEACEYKNSYHSMIPSIKVVLNCEHDHVDFFPTLDDVIASFNKYIGDSQKENGLNVAVVNADCENSVKASKNTDASVYYYSVKDKTDFYAYDLSMELGYAVLSIHLANGENICNINLAVPGMHNASNAVAAAAAASLAGVDSDSIKKGLESFTGVSRRFEKLGEYNGAVLIDDYAHHPDEIKVTLETARLMNPKRIICVFQPHTYSRTFGLLDSFANTLSIADKVYLCDIFPAREQNIYGISSGHIANKMENAEYIDSFEAIAEKLMNELENGDFCITMGAGRANEIAKMILNNNR